MGDLVFNGGNKCSSFTDSIDSYFVAFEGKYGIWGGNQQ